MIGGFGLAAWAIQLGVRVTDQWGFWEFFWLQALRSVGMMIAMVASQQMSVASLPVSQMKDASGLINLTRNVGGAIGLALLTTVLGVQTKSHYLDITTAASTANAASVGLLDRFTTMMTESGAADPAAGARAYVAGMIRRQAEVLAFGDAFAVLAIACALAVGLALFVRPIRLDGRPQPEASD